MTEDQTRLLAGFIVAFYLLAWWHFYRDGRR
jgi:hypothetical protein